MEPTVTIMEENPFDCESICQESTQRISWEPKPIKIKAIDGSYFDLMDYIGGDCPLKKGSVSYLPVDDKYNDQNNREHRQKIVQHVKESCTDAGFSVCIESWDARSERISIVCTRGRKYRPQNKKGMRKRTTKKPMLKEDICPFRFNVHWFQNKRCWGIKAGYGERCHRGHHGPSEASIGLSKKNLSMMNDCAKEVSFFDECNPLFQEICTMAELGGDYRRMLEKGMSDLLETAKRKYGEENNEVNNSISLANRKMKRIHAK